MSTIIYTKVDEAPALATYSLLPIIKTFTRSSGIQIIQKDISLAARIIAAFPENLKAHQKKEDHLAQLGELTKDKNVNIIKLPNISASIPQLKDAIKELQSKNYNIPSYDESEEIKQKYSKILGSAVNPILREGNSDRRAPACIKKFAKNNPHTMGDWVKTSKTNVMHMSQKDFYESEVSKTFDKSDDLKIIYINEAGDEVVLKSSILVQKEEIIDASCMNIEALEKFYEKAIQKAKEEDILLSLHLKATMMKISDPIMFGSALKVYFKDLITKHATLFKKLDVNFNNGLSDLYSKIENINALKKEEILKDIALVYSKQPKLAMVDSEKGITNLHIPSSVIIDASMPAMIRNGGKMYNKNGTKEDTIAMIPDRSYAGVFQEVINDCKENGTLDVSKIGSVSNVGLMAQKAEEYGSHDKTFQAQGKGIIKVINKNLDEIFTFQVEKGDIFRMCQTKDDPIKNWVELAINRARISHTPAIFWLDSKRGHDVQIIKKVKQYLDKKDLSDVELKIMSPIEATRYSLQRMRQGLDTISVTGNVLRDYNTDLFPILELGTSSKMLSIVPLMNGGGLFETGAGGSAPKHVQQLQEENHLRWDSLGEFMALQASLEYLSVKNKKASILSKTLDNAISKLLEENKSPSRKTYELDNRGSHFYLAMFWAKELSQQNEDIDLKNEFNTIAKSLIKNEKKIIEELTIIQGYPQTMNGYYLAEDRILRKIMRPSKTFNSIIKYIEE